MSVYCPYLSTSTVHCTALVTHCKYIHGNDPYDTKAASKEGWGMLDYLPVQTTKKLTR